MVYHANVAEVRANYEPFVGKADHMGSLQDCDTDAALAMARLSPNENVLDLGTGAGRALVAAKLAVGNGICVGVDAVQGFLDVDVAARLQHHQLTRAPAGNDDTKVFLLKASATQGDLPKLVNTCVGQPIQFNVIFAVHLFNTITPAQRRQALQTWSKMLAEGGRLIVSMSPTFSKTPASPFTIGASQFTVGATETPGCVFFVKYDTSVAYRLLVDNSKVAKPQIINATQLSPDDTWQEGHRQAEEAAASVKLRVVTCKSIGKGDSFGLPQTSPSLSEGELGRMSLQQLQQWRNGLPINGFHYLGRFHQACLERKQPAIANLPGARRTDALVLGLQDEAKALMQGFRHPDASKTVSFRAECAQAGVLVELQHQ
jgi:SAM-dependent methyltransferase